MTLATLPRTLLNRWYLTLGGLAVTIGLCFISLMLIQPVQEVRASVLLLPPKSSVGLGGNPYLGLGGLKQPVDVLVRALTAQDTMTEVARKWPEATYTVEPDYLTNGPILVITVGDRDPLASLAVTEHLLALVPSTLENLQTAQGVRTNSRITSTVIAQDRVPELIRKTQLRAVVLIGALGVAGTALLVAVIDGLLVTKAAKDPLRASGSDPHWPIDTLDCSLDWGGEAAPAPTSEAVPHPVSGRRNSHGG